MYSHEREIALINRTVVLAKGDKPPPFIIVSLNLVVERLTTEIIMQVNFKFGKDAKAFVNRNDDSQYKLVQTVENSQYNATFVSGFHTVDEIKAGVNATFFLSKMESGPDGKTYAEFREITNNGISVADLLKQAE